jgi:hypothetical protein
MLIRKPRPLAFADQTGSKSPQRCSIIRSMYPSVYCACITVFSMTNPLALDQQVDESSGDNSFKRDILVRIDASVVLFLTDVLQILSSA